MSIHIMVECGISVLLCNLILMGKTVIIILQLLPKEPLPMGATMLMLLKGLGIIIITTINQQMRCHRDTIHA